jgi:hypothetical protein
MNLESLLQDILEELLEGENDTNETAHKLRSLADELDDGNSLSEDEVVRVIAAIYESI